MSLLEFIKRIFGNHIPDVRKKVSFIKPARKVNRIFLHCSASDYSHHDNIETIEAWHKKRGFAQIGYHYYIDKQGVIHNGRPLRLQPAAQYPHNKGTIAICLGGLNDFTEKQFKSLRALCEAINEAYEGEVSFHGHNEVSNKLCPVFNYRQVLSIDSNGRYN